MLWCWTGMKPTWSLCVVFIVFCWFQVEIILSRLQVEIILSRGFWILVHQRNCSIIFIFSCTCFSFHGNADLQSNFQIIPLLYSSWNNLIKKKWWLLFKDILELGAGDLAQQLITLADIGECQFWFLVPT